MCQEHRHGTLQETIENFRSPMPLPEKLRLFLRNNWIKLKTGSDCCGNHGEPGC